MSSGILKDPDMWKYIIPAQLTPSDQLKSTVGLGDSISSTAFAFDGK